MTPTRKLVKGRIRLIKHTDLLRCPHAIIASEHYRDDGTCKCNDPKETVMREWGYTWDPKAKVWKS